LGLTGVCVEVWIEYIQKRLKLRHVYLKADVNVHREGAHRTTSESRALNVRYAATLATSAIGPNTAISGSRLPTYCVEKLDVEMIFPRQQF
jgi:hypothetical protein